MDEIYKISNIINGWVYIGSTANTIQNRYNSHFSRLRNNKHHCLLLQKDFNKYGEGAFIIMYVESVETKDRYIREEYYINKYIDYLYNTQLIPTENITHEEHIITKIADSNRKVDIQELKDVLINLIYFPELTKETIFKDSIYITESIFNHTVLENDRNIRAVIKDEELQSLIVEYKKSNRCTQHKAINGGLFFKSDKGVIHEVKPTLTKFCKEHNLTQPKMSEVKNGNRKHHKGWTLYRP